jgi:hypothetical protein
VKAKNIHQNRKRTYQLSLLLFLLSLKPDNNSNKKQNEPGIVVHSCNLATQEVKAGGLQVPGQPR